MEKKNSRNSRKCVIIWLVVSNIFDFHPETWGRWTHFDSYFSKRLKPPTSFPGSFPFWGVFFLRRISLLVLFWIFLLVFCILWSDTLIVDMIRCIVVYLILLNTQIHMTIWFGLTATLQAVTTAWHFLDQPDNTFHFRGRSSWEIMASQPT